MNTTAILELAKKSEGGDADALRELRKGLLGISLTNDLDKMSERWAAVVLVARMLLNLVWANVYTDSKFSVEDSDVEPLARNLGRFIHAAVEEGDDGSEAMGALTDFAMAFRATIAKLNQEGEEPWVAEHLTPTATGKEDTDGSKVE